MIAALDRELCFTLNNRASDRILAAGFDRHLVKPADVDGLQALLATLESDDHRS